MYAVMKERVPELRHDLDEWTRRMMSWHFSPGTGSPFWLAQRASLPFDPVRDITGFDGLRAFGLFDKRRLREASARDLLPSGFAGRPFRVFETGGTTGRPCRIVNVARLDQDVAMYRTMLQARGVAGGDILAMTPGGPHAYGHFVEGLADSWQGAVFSIDFDPRWIKEELRRGAAAGADSYTGHLVRQTRELLGAERPELLFTTSRLLLALVARLDRPLAGYGIRAVCTGGVSCTAEEARLLRAEYLPGVQWIDTYGNTLAGHALQADTPDTATGRSYHLPPPLAVLRVVDRDDPFREVGVGERGQVLVTTLLEDLFLPNLLERDSAVRTGPHPWFPWDGVADVHPLDDGLDAITEGVY